MTHPLFRPRTLALLWFVATAGTARAADLVVFGDALAPGWQDWSWNTAAAPDPSLAFSGAASLRVTFRAGWAGLKLHAPTPVRGATAVRFAVYGDAPLKVLCYDGVEAGGKEVRGRANAWTTVTVPLAECGRPARLTDIAVQNFGDAPNRAVRLDDLRLVAAAPDPAPAARPAGPPAPRGYSASGGRFYRAGAEIELHGLNWFGLEGPDRNLHGLWTGRTIRSFVNQMADLGFTAWRLPLSPQTIRPGFKAADWGSAAGRTGRQVVEEFLRAAAERNMFVLLDFHTYDPRLLAERLPGRPFGGAYTKADWLSDLRTMATLAKSHPNVIGVDLCNEPHALTWSEWKSLATEGGRAVLGANPDLLVFVEGVGNASDYGGPYAFWGENLTEAGVLADLPANKLVYSPHTYGPSVATQGYFADPTFPNNLPAIWNTHFGHLAAKGFTLAIGEFGGRYEGRDRVWQDKFVDYLRGRGVNAFFYWSLNPNSGDTAGLLLDDWKAVNAAKLALLKRLMR